MRIGIVKGATFLTTLSMIASTIVMPRPVVAQTDARTACMNQWLFNGAWRAKVTKVEPLMDGGKQAGWQVTQVWRNGTSRELSPADSSVKPMDLHLSNSVLEVEGHNSEQLGFDTMAPSGELTYTAIFYGPNMTVDPNDKPKSLDVTFDDKVVSQSNKPHFTSGRYNFHFDLGCVATGASAQAQGGSTQLAASNGCMNQWMSNGIWKMRVLAVTPFPVGTTAQNQWAWQIRQEWVNISHSRVSASGLSDATRRIVPTNVGDEFLATKSGNNSSSSGVAGGLGLDAAIKGDLAPGASITFSPVVAGGVFHADDAPARLLVTFDTASQDKAIGWLKSLPVPRYRKPADFRINLTCGGHVTMAPGVESSQTSPQSQHAGAAQSANPSAGSRVTVDPCSMLRAHDVASALGVAAASLGTPQHPSPNECTWAVASHAGQPAQDVALTMQTVQAAPRCRGLGCLRLAQALGEVSNVLGVPGVPSVPAQLSQAFNDAHIIADLGDKAAWKDGRLTVLKADMAFQVLVRGSRSPALATSEALARTVLDHLSTP